MAFARRVFRWEQVAPLARSPKGNRQGPQSLLRPGHWNSRDRIAEALASMQGADPNEAVSVGNDAPIAAWG